VATQRGVDQAVPDVSTYLSEHGGSIRDLALLTQLDDDGLDDDGLDGDGLVGIGEIVPEMFVPGTDVVRTSVLATYADIVAGKLANSRFAPSICVTLDLDLHLVRSPSGSGLEPGDGIRCRSSVVRAGRRIVVMGFDITSVTGVRVGFGHAGFMASPNPDHVAPNGFGLVSTDAERGRLDTPFAARAGVQRLGGGRAELPYRLDNINATGALQGGLLALCAEEAVLEAQPAREIGSLGIRYLRAFRRTSALAEATIEGDVARVELRDEAGELGAVVVASLRA
jgi:acyl-coenzyme A thioesterase PaaI-like protein